MAREAAEALVDPVTADDPKKKEEEEKKKQQGKGATNGTPGKDGKAKDDGLVGGKKEKKEELVSRLL